MNSKATYIISWIARLAAIAIMGQSLYFKFTAHPDSVAIFTDIGMEPTGRILIGIIELVACLLMLNRVGTPYGALLGFGVMGGAIMGHFTEIGFEGARGELAALAFVVIICCSIVIYIRRADLPLVGRAIKK